MPGLVPGIHDFPFIATVNNAWMAGTSPARTVVGFGRRVLIGEGGGYWVPAFAGMTGRRGVEVEASGQITRCLLRRVLLAAPRR